MTLQLIGIDLAKNVFHLHGVDGNGREVFRKRVYRDELLASLRAVNPCKVVMEACSGANPLKLEHPTLSATPSPDLR